LTIETLKNGTPRNQNYGTDIGYDKTVVYVKLNTYFNARSFYHLIIKHWNKSTTF